MDPRRDEARDDDSWLDRLLGRFLDELAAGRAIDVAAHAAERPHLAARIADLVATASEIALARPLPLPRVGGYAIVGELGRGGMGTVYLARQEGLGRRVALKVMPSRWAAGSRGRERFLREARAVARLRHDHIVPVHDVGEVDGTPWFSMEWIEGRTLAEGLDRLRRRGRPAAELTAADLAEAFGLEPDRLSGDPVECIVRWIEPLARALDHAHGHGVVHRDVKPSNVLVRRDGVALLVDFGLAAIEDEAPLTAESGFVGTPHYASPEQARGAAGIGPPSDVYSLGAVLYELLTLRRPAEGPTAQEVLRRVEREDPPPPRALNPRVPRDLDTIVCAAMEKEPARRYLSAAAFADDLARFLRGAPVAARPVGPLGRLSRFVRREPTLAASGALALLILVGTPTGLWWRQRERTLELRRAHVLAQTKARVVGFVEEMLTSLNPNHAKGRNVTMRDVLDDAARRIDDGLPDEPEVEIELRLFIGETYHSLGLPDEAERQFERAHARALALARPVLVAHSVNGLAIVAFDRADYPRAEALCSDAIAGLAAAGARETPEMARALNDVALVRLARCDYERARTAFDESLALLRRLGDEGEVATCMTNYGALLIEQGHLSDAESILREALALRRRLGAGDHLNVAFDLDYLGRICAESDRPKEARAAREEALAIERKLLGDRAPWTVMTLAELAGSVARDEGTAAAAPLVREAQSARADLETSDSIVAASALLELGVDERLAGELEDAEKDLRTAVARFEKRVGAEHIQAATALGLLARVLGERGRYAESERLSREALARLRRIAGSHDDLVAEALVRIAWCCDARFAAEEGVRDAREALDLFTNRVGPDCDGACASRDALGYLEHQRGADQDAEELLRDNVERRRRRRGEDHPDVAITLGFLGEVVEARGRAEEAADLYRRAVEIERAKAGEANLELASNLHRLGRSLLLRRKLDEAEAPLEEALEIRRERLGDGHLHLVYSLNTVGVLHQLRQQYAEAQPLFEEAVEMSRAVLDPKHPDLGISLANLGGVKLLQDDLAGAEPLLVEGHAILSKARGARHPDTLTVEKRLVRLYRALGRPEQAAPFVALLAAAGVTEPEAR